MVRLWEDLGPKRDTESVDKETRERRWETLGS